MDLNFSQSDAFSIKLCITFAEINASHLQSAFKSDALEFCMDNNILKHVEEWAINYKITLAKTGQITCYTAENCWQSH